MSVLDLINQSNSNARMLEITLQGLEVDKQDIALVDSFFSWLVYKEGFPVDGYVVTRLRECITAQSDIELFTKHYNDVFINDSDYLRQCAIDIIDYYHSGVELPDYCEYH